MEGRRQRGPSEEEERNSNKESSQRRSGHADARSRRGEGNGGLRKDFMKIDPGWIYSRGHRLLGHREPRSSTRRRCSLRPEEPPSTKSPMNSRSLPRLYCCRSLTPRSIRYPIPSWQAAPIPRESRRTRCCCLPRGFSPCLAV